MNKKICVVEADINRNRDPDAIRLMCFSDTHGRHNNIKKENIHQCDIAICAGDFSLWGNPSEVRSFLTFIKGLPAKHKIIIAGNLDLTFDKERLSLFSQTFEENEFGDDTNSIKDEFINDQSVNYLENSSIELEGIKFYGSPYTPNFGDFGFPTYSNTAEDVWSNIPLNTDVLITHGPPHLILDRTNSGFRAGCPFLRKRIEQVVPSLVLFGHIHEAHGCEKIGDTIYSNVSVVDFNRYVVHSPTYFDIIKRG